MDRDSVDFKHILDSAPVPILLYQEGQLVYGNTAAFEVFRFCGHAILPEALGGFDPLQLVDPKELVEVTKDLGLVLQSGETLRNIPRTLRDVQGNRIATLVSAGPGSWEGRPAVEVSFVIVGLYPLVRQGEGGAETPWREPLPDARVGILEVLAPREAQVALLITEGLDTAAIRDRLHIATSTLRGYIKSIYRKLGVHSRSELVRRVIGHR